MNRNRWLISLPLQSFKVQLNSCGVKHSLIVDESRNLVICYLLFTCPIIHLGFNSVHWTAQIINAFSFLHDIVLKFFFSSPPEAICFACGTDNLLQRPFHIILKRSKYANCRSYLFIESTLLHIIHVCWKEPVSCVRQHQGFSGWALTLSCLLL